MKKFSWLNWFIPLLIVVSMTGSFIYLKFLVKRPLVEIAGQELLLEIVKTPESMAKGLSGLPFLEYNKGMLFLFDGYQKPSFWMKDMRFPIDIIWINGDIVAGIDKNLPPALTGEPPVYNPPVFIDKVLEVNAGFSDKNGLKIGDKVKFRNF